MYYICDGKSQPYRRIGDVEVKLVDKITYIYIKKIKKWMECPVCHNKMLFDKKGKLWKCNNCSYDLPETEFLDDFVFWFCDGCGEYLNIQEGFNRKGTEWTCTKCGFNNDTTLSNIKGECKDCGKLLENPDATICSKCKIIRMQKAQLLLESVADICYSMTDSLKESNERESEEEKWYD